MFVTADFSDEFYELLHHIAGNGGPAADVASAFLASQVAISPSYAYLPDEKNWYSIGQIDGKAVITHTTHAKSRGVNYYTPGGHRIAEKPGRAAQRVTGITDGKALAAFAEACQKHYVVPDVRVFRGLDIREWYQNKNYCRCVGTGFGDLWSCMSGNGTGDAGLFSVYEDVCELAIVICPECDKLQARSLVWTNTDGERFYDRVYYKKAKHRDAIVKWAESQGMSSCYGGGARGKFAIPRTYDRLPYLDSMRVSNACPVCLTFTNEYGRHECPGAPVKTDWEEPRLHYWATRERVPAHAHCEECGDMVYPDGGVEHRVYCPEHARYYCGGQCPACHASDYCTWCGGYYSDDDDHTITCDDCGTEYCESRGECPNERWCDNCEDYYCGDECPNERPCRTCDEWYCGDECPNTNECEGCYVELPCGTTLCDECVKCNACGGINTDEELRENEGRCSGERRLNGLDWDAIPLYGRCDVMLKQEYQTRALATIPDLRPVFINLGQYPLPGLGYDQPRV